MQFFIKHYQGQTDSQLFLLFVRLQISKLKINDYQKLLLPLYNIK